MPTAPLPPPPGDAGTTRTERTIEKTRRNGLPTSKGGKVRGGHGSSVRCDGCDEPITQNEREFEVAIAEALTFHFHAECHAAWLAFTADSGSNGPRGGE
jgi:hypothetical protein